MIPRQFKQKAHLSIAVYVKFGFRKIRYRIEQLRFNDGNDGKQSNGGGTDSDIRDKRCVITLIDRNVNRDIEQPFETV